MANHALTSYLNDHLGGSVAALQMLDRLADATGDDELRQFFVTLRADVAADRDVLESFLKRIGGLPSGPRAVGGWVAEKLGHLKLMLDDPKGGTLDRLEMLEFLALGILGKRALWEALAAAGGAIPHVETLDLERLIRRAGDQHARVEQRRLDSARRVLAGEKME